MKIFTDKKLQNEISELDLGIVEAGEVETFTFYVLNDSDAYLRELVFSVEHQEVEIIKAPKELGMKKSNELVIEWKPKITLKEGLKTILHIKGIELWGGSN